MTTLFPTLIVSTVVLATSGIAHAATTEIPVPPPRPTIETDGAEDRQKEVGRAENPKRPETQSAPRFDRDEAIACEAALRRDGVRFRRMDAIDDGGGCGAQRPLQVTEVGNGISVSTDVRLRCKAARALHDWVTQVVAPSARTHLDARLTEIRISTSYQCRRRNNAATGKLSEHAFANGIDVMAFVFADRPPVPILSRPHSDNGERVFQATARGGACAYFTTVLGPGTDAAHQRHFHLDLAERRNAYRICQ